MTDTDVAAAQAFIDKWQGVAASELSTSQSFLIDLCDLLGVDRPHPTAAQDYMFERPLTFRHADGSSPGQRQPIGIESRAALAGGDRQSLHRARAVEETPPATAGHAGRPGPRRSPRRRGLWGGAVRVNFGEMQP